MKKNNEKATHFSHETEIAAVDLKTNTCWKQKRKPVSLLTESYGLSSWSVMKRWEARSGENIWRTTLMSSAVSSSVS